jgi:hypothetical protein
LDSRLGEHQSRSGRGGEDEIETMIKWKKYFLVNLLLPDTGINRQPRKLNQLSDEVKG